MNYGTDEITETLANAGVPALFDTDPNALHVLTEYVGIQTADRENDPATMERKTFIETAVSRMLTFHDWEVFNAGRDYERSQVSMPMPVMA